VALLLVLRLLCCRLVFSSCLSGSRAFLLLDFYYVILERGIKMDEKQVQEALARIDQVVSQVNMPRQAHMQLTQDLQLIQRCCVELANLTTEAKKSED